MKKFCFLVFFPAVFLSAQDVESPARRYNAALDALRGGDPAAAAGIFSGLDGADAAHGLGIALCRIAEIPDSEPPTNAQMRVKSAKRRVESLEKGAEAFRAALELVPDDAACATNLATAAEALARARAELADAELDEKYGSSDGVALLEKLIDAQRAAYAAGASAFADDSPSRIRALEKAAEKQRAAAEIWKPVAEKLSAAAQNAGQEGRDAYEEFLHGLAVAADCAAGAASALDDMNPDALDAMKKAELSGIGAMSAIAPPPKLLATALSVQSNALARTARNELPRTPVQDQMLAADAFAVVKDRLPGWLESVRQTQQIDTNEVARLADGISAEHAEIAGAVDSASAVLPEAVLPHAQTAFEDMAQLLALLNPPQQNRQDSQQEQQRDQQQSRQQDQRSGEQNAEQPEGGEERDGSSSEDRSEKNDEENAEEGEPSAREERDPEREEAEKMMRAVLMQEKERAAEKRRRERTMPARVGERDW